VVRQRVRALPDAGAPIVGVGLESLGQRRQRGRPVSDDALERRPEVVDGIRAVRRPSRRFCGVEKAPVLLLRPLPLVGDARRVEDAPRVGADGEGDPPLPLDVDGRRDQDPRRGTATCPVRTCERWPRRWSPSSGALVPTCRCATAPIAEAGGERSPIGGGEGAPDVPGLPAGFGGPDDSVLWRFLQCRPGGGVSVTYPQRPRPPRRSLLVCALSRSSAMVRPAPSTNCSTFAHRMDDTSQGASCRASGSSPRIVRWASRCSASLSSSIVWATSVCDRRVGEGAASAPLPCSRRA